MGQDEVEWLGPESEDLLDTAPRRRRRPPRWVVLAVAALAALAAVVAVITGNNTGRPTATASTSSTSSGARVVAGKSAPARRTAPRRTTPAPSRRPSPRIRPVVVRRVGHRLLGVHGAWELFGRGDGVLVRIQLARGRITRTAVPALSSSGPVALLVGTHRVVIRPLDYVAGFAVPDGRPARAAPGALQYGGLAYPGPEPNEAWVDSGGRLTLVGLDGRRVAPRTSMDVLPNFTPVGPDAAGYVLELSVGGIYDQRPDGLTRVTHGQLLAVGPTRWLIYDCGRHGRCGTVVVDRASGARRRLPGQATYRATLGNSVGSVGSVGSIAPDGATALLFAGDIRNSDRDRLILVDLRTGAATSLPITVDSVELPEPGTGIAWSPDGRWLFVAAAHGRLRVIDVRTLRVRSLGVRLPPLRQLAVRPG